MSRFVLTAQLQLQAPNNVAQVVRQIQSQLNNVSVNVQVQGAARAQRQLQQVTAQTQAATTAADRMGRAFAISIRRFAAFSIATRAVSLFTSTLSNAVKTAIDFEREMVRVSQITGETVGKLKFLTKAITDLSTGFGVSSKDLLTTGQLLLQAGINAKDTEVALKTLAKAALAPNFDSLSETTEGAIAILAQFQEGVGALEKQLGAINAVAGAFAVEAGDLIDVIRRAGGIFKASGGDLNELIALFTSVRATTRESAESIGTGLRTIFTRIQRPKTIEFLKQFGVELVDLEGKFVGPFEAVKRLSGALAGLGEGDITFIRIAEELGGFRQIGKVLPLLQQFSTAQSALNVAQKAGNSLTTDAATAQQALAIRIIKVKEEFLALIRSVTETTTFQVMANTALSLASALIKIGEAIKPLLPLLAAVAAVNFARGISTFAGGLMRGMQSGRTYSTGGKVHHFARGGMVPGTGNRDTVPAMLQPGEFVIRKSSVNRLGAGNLAAMNENRFAKGGKLVKDIANTSGASQQFKNSVVSTSEQPFRQGSAINSNDIFNANLDWKPISKSMVENDIKNKKVPPDTLQKLLSQSNAEKGDAFEAYLIKSGRTNLKRTANPIYPVDFTSGVGKYAEAKNIKTTLPDSVYLDKLFRARVADKSYSSLKETPSSKGGQNIDLGKLQVFYRKFAKGGLVNEQNIGAAILENVGFNSSNKFKVSRQDIESKLPKTLRLNEQYPIKGQKTLTLQSEGLSGATYEKFKNIIDTNIISAAEDSAIMLGSSLGLAAKKSIPANEAQRFLAGVNDASVGNLFEDTLKVLSGPPFSSDPQRSFDFTNGLSNILKDDYRNLSSKYIDAKSSSKRASIGWETKIANTLASEAISSNFTRTETQEEKRARESAEFRKAFGKSAKKKFFGGIIQKFAEGGEAIIQKGVQSIGVGIFDSDMIAGGTNIKNGILQALLGSGKPYSVISGPAGSGKTTFATNRFGRNFVLSPQDLEKYGRFVVLSGAGVTKSGGFSTETDRLLSGAKDITVLSPDEERLMKQRQGRLDAAMSGGSLDQRSTGALKGTLKAPTSANLDLFKRFKNVRVLQQYAKGGIIQKFAVGGEAQKIANTMGKGKAIADSWWTGMFAGNNVLFDWASPTRAFKIPTGEEIPIDQNLRKVLRDKAQREWMAYQDKNKKTTKPLTDAERAELRKYDVSPEQAEKIKKEAEAKRAKAYVDRTSGINWDVESSGRRRRKPEDYLRRARGFATGGGVGTDTVPALLTPGEFVVNRSSAQRIGYGNLNRMNKVGKYAKGGIVQHFQSGTAMAGAQPARSASNPNTVAFVSAQALTQSAQAIKQQTQATQQNTQSQRSVAKSGMEVVNNNKMFAATMATSLIAGFLPAVDEASSGMLKLTHHMLGVATTLTSVMFALEAFGVALNAKQIMQLFGRGPGGLGSLIKNAFSGFKMGASGMAGPMPLGGGVASRVGGMFGSAKSVAERARAGLNRTLDPSLLQPSFSLGRQGRRLSSLSGGRVPLTARLGNLAGRATQGINVPNLGVGKALSGVSQRLSPYTSAIPTGFRAGFAGKKIVGGNMLSRSIGTVSSGFGTFGRGISAGLSGKSVIGGGSKSILGNLGGLIGKGGFKAGGLASRGAGLVARGAGALAGGAGSLGGAALAAAGPITAITGLVAIVNGAVGAFKDLDGQLQKSIQAGKVEEASKLAVAKAAGDFPLVGNLLQGWSSSFDNLLVSAATIFGGPSLESVKALAASQAGAVRTQKQLEKAQKTATQAMEDFSNGSISASEALSRIRTASTEVAKQEKRASDFATANLENRASDGFTGRNVASFLTFGMVESSSQRNQRLGQQSAEQINQAAKFESERFQMESPARAAMIRSGIARGRSASEIRREAVGGLESRLSEQRLLGNRLQAAGDEAGAKAAFAAAAQLEEQIKQVDREMASLEKEVGRAKAAFEAMDLGLRGPTATANAMSASMNRFVAGLEVGGNSFVANTEFLSQAVTGAAQAMENSDIKQAIDGVANSLQDMGVDPAKFRANTEAFIQAQQNYNKAFKNIKDRIKGDDFTGMDADTLKKEFAKELTVGLGGDAKKNLTAIIEGMQLSDKEVDDILGGNLQVFGDKLGEAGQKQLEQIMKIAQERQKAEQVVIGLIQQRAEAERNLAQAQKDAIDLYMEGRDIQAKYGGRAVTSEERRSAVLARANTSAKSAGIGGLRTGNTAELRQRQNQISAGFGMIQVRRGIDGGMQGTSGVEAANRQQALDQAQKDQVETIRALIKLEEEELKIIQEKNKLEKDSLESLISGDVDKFFEGQAAMGAQAAIAAGNMDLAKMFGGKAIGDAFKDIQRQQEAGVQTMFGRQLGGPGGLAEQAAGAALASRGVMDPRMAQRLAGTTPEEEAAKRRLQELGGLLGEAGAAGAAMAEMQVQTAIMNVENAELKLSKIEEEGRRVAQGMYRGGVVYANRGIFVPRGTDTVPAMLTPGEFVVRREAVNRGNNLQLLRAINSGGNASGMARGGKVGYYNNGGTVQYKALGDLVANLGQAIGIDPQLITNLGNVFTKFVTNFNDSIKNLQNTKVQVKMDSVDVNVNIMGGGMLNQISDSAKQQIMSEVIQKIQSQYGLGSNGNIVEKSGNLAKPGQGA